MKRTSKSTKREQYAQEAWIEAVDIRRGPYGPLADVRVCYRDDVDGVEESHGFTLTTEECLGIAEVLLSIAKTLELDSVYDLACGVAFPEEPKIEGGEA